MPCYDKKLEAVRPTLPDGRMEVDTVLATHELIELLEKKDLPKVDQVKAGQPLHPLIETLLSQSKGDFLTSSRFNRQSNSYLESIFRLSASDLFGIPIPSDQPLDYTPGRNKDLQEVTLKDKDGKVLLKFAQAYGFRNI